MSNFSFCHNDFKSCLLQRRHKATICGERVNCNQEGFTLLFSVRNNRRQQNEFQTFCDHAENMRLTLLSSSQLLINHFLLPKYAL